MENCGSCKRWKKFNIKTPVKPKSKALKFLFLSFTIKPSSSEMVSYGWNLLHSQRGNCRRYPKIYQTQKTHYCSEYKGSSNG